MLAALVHPFAAEPTLFAPRAHTHTHMRPHHHRRVVVRPSATHCPVLLHEPTQLAFEDTLRALHNALLAEDLDLDLNQPQPQPQPQEQPEWHVTSEVSRASGDGRTITRRTMVQPATGQRKVVTVHTLADAPQQGVAATKTTETTTTTPGTATPQGQQQDDAEPSPRVEVTGVKGPQEFDALWEARAKDTAGREARAREERERRHRAAVLRRVETEAAMAARFAKDLQRRADAAWEHAAQVQQTLGALRGGQEQRGKAEKAATPAAHHDTTAAVPATTTTTTTTTPVVAPTFPSEASSERGVEQEAHERQEQDDENTVVVEDVDDEDDEEEGVDDFEDVTQAASDSQPADEE